MCPRLGEGRGDGHPVDDELLVRGAPGEAVADALEPHLPVHLAPDDERHVPRLVAVAVREDVRPDGPQRPDPVAPHDLRIERPDDATDELVEAWRERVRQDDGGRDLLVGREVPRQLVDQDVLDPLGQRPEPLARFA